MNAYGGHARAPLVPIRALILPLAGHAGEPPIGPGKGAGEKLRKVRF